MYRRCSSRSLVAPNVALSATFGAVLLQTSAGQHSAYGGSTATAAAWYNGQSVHEVGQSVNVAGTPSIKWAGTLENATNLSVITGAF